MAKCTETKLPIAECIRYLHRENNNRQIFAETAVVALDEYAAQLAAAYREIERLRELLKKAQPELSCLIRQTNATPGGSVWRVHEAIVQCLKEPPNAQ